MRKGYVPGRWGQVHYREIGAGPAVACLHATAYSSRSLAPLLAALAARGRRAIGLDTPGYGQSDPPPAPPDFAAYVHALAEAVAQLAPGAVDLFGYHTGALIAAEIAALRPELVRRVVLIGLPLFAAAEKPAWRAKLVRPTTLGDRLEQFAERWDYLVTHRPTGMGLRRAVDNFADELQVAPSEWWAHAALFDHDPAPLLASIACPVLIINPDSPLAEASRRGAAAIPGATLEERPELRGAIFETDAGRVAATIDGFLG